MVPPDALFGVIPVWVGVYALTLITLAVAGYAVYRPRVPADTTGPPGGALRPSPDAAGRRRQHRPGPAQGLQRVGRADPRSRRIDLAGIGHAAIFWGFLSFSLSYLIFIFGGSIWHPLAETILTKTGVLAYSVYLDVLAVVVLAALAWALFRRWVAQPHRLTFDLTRKGESVIIVGLTGGLMLATLLVHSFYVAAGGSGPEAGVPVGGAIGGWFRAPGDVRGHGGRLAGGFLVGSPAHHPGLCAVHSLLQAHPYGGGAAERLFSAAWNRAAPCKSRPLTWRLWTKTPASAPPASRTSPGNSCWTAMPAPSADAAPTPARRIPRAKSCPRCTSWRTSRSI